MITRNDNDFDIIRDLLEELSCRPVLLVDVVNVQLLFLARIYAYSVYEVSGDYQVLGSLGHVHLLRVPHFAV
jgi:hypothetical protein